MTPQSRKEQLLAQRVGDELVIYDERTHQAHRLNPTAALVWDMADGQRSVPDLAVSLRNSLAERLLDGAMVDEGDSEELVRLAVNELERAGLLLERGLPSLGEPMSRRQMMAVTAALLPVVASILAPTPAMAQTGINPFAVYNGNYSGTGNPSPTNNPCRFNPTPVTMALTLNAAGAGTLNITHVNAAVTFVANAVAAVVNATTINVTGTGSGGGFNTSNQFTFVQGSPGTGNGAQTISGNCLGTAASFPFNITTTKS